MTTSSRARFALTVSGRRTSGLLGLAAAVTVAAAMSLAPAPGASADSARTVAVIDREDIALSGAHSIADFLNHRLGDGYFNTFGIGRLNVLGGAPILVDGRRAWGAGAGIRPISAIERIEILGGDSSALYGADAAGGAINIVLRRDYEGVEASVAASRPSEMGGEAEQVSALWGGTLGRGHMTIGVNGSRQQEVQDKDRQFSNARWTPGGAIAAAQGVSGGGNTVLFTHEGKPRTPASASTARTRCCW